MQNPQVDNIKAELKGNVLTLTIKLEPGRLSSSGKTILRATTHGSWQIPDTDLTLGLNIYQPKDKFNGRLA